MPSLGGESSVGETEVWLTPPYILDALGEFDLDPCSPLGRPWDTAKNHYTVEDDGLVQPWYGRIWLNPPYGRAMTPWLEKMANYDGGGVALVFARTETRNFQELIFPYADAILFLRGRLAFHRPDGSQAQTAQAPSVLIAYGEQEIDALEKSGLDGKLVRL